MRIHPLHHHRSGFTLIELIAAMSLAILITGLAVGALSSGAFGSQRVVQSADRASGWLIIAKQRAMRDGLPRGVRFLRNGTNFITEAQHVESPDPWLPNPTSDPSGSRIILAYTIDTATNVVNGRHAYFIGDTTTFDSTVFTGDVLSMLEFSPIPYRITTITPGAMVNLNGTPTTAHELTLSDYPDLGPAGSASTTPPTATRVVTAFSFQPQPRPIFGEPLLQLTGSAAIEATTLPSTPTPIATCLNVPASGDFDIMFTPSGQVLNQTAGFQTLWVRQITETYVAPDQFDNAGEQVLVVIYTKTGAVSTVAVNPDVNDPHKFARDGVNSGL